MHTTHSPRHLRNAALAGLAVGALTFGFVAGLAASGGSAAIPAAAGATPTAPVPTASVPGAAAPGPATLIATNSSHRSTKAKVPANPVTPHWAGPILLGGVYDHATATFIVPEAKCSKTFTDSAFWVGLDGVTDGTVEQNGVDVACSGGQAYYLPWTEEYPAPPVYLQPSQFSVVPGDKVTVTVSATATTDTFTFNNATTDTSFTTTATAAQGALDNSAECIVEAPGAGYTGKYTKLTDFGKVTFTQCEAQAVSPTKANCNLVTGQGCPTGSHLVDANIGTRKHHSTKVHAATMLTGDGGFVVTWHHN